MQRSHIIALILFAIGLRVLYLLLSLATDPDARNSPVYNEYINISKRNDSYWYEGIAKDWYPKIENKKEIGYWGEGELIQSSWAFFPFYPYLIRQTQNLFNLDFDKSALIWSLFFSTLSIIGVYLFGVLFFKDESKAFYCTIVLFLFPFSFYFSMFYTEALFLAFLVFSFIAIHYKKYLLLSALLIPLVLVRPNGVISLVPLYLYYLEQNNLIYKLNFDWNAIFTRKNIFTSLVFTSGVIAFFAYCFYQYTMTGEFFAFSIAQQGWMKRLAWPWESFFYSGEFAVQFHSYYTLIAIVFAVVIAKKLPLSLNVFIWLSLLLTLTSGSIISMARYISVLFPLILVLGSMIYRHRTKYLWLMVLLVLHLASFYTLLSANRVSF